MMVSLKVNGKPYSLDVAENETLSEVLRYRLGFMSVKEGCGEGDCGLCIVLLNGRPVHSCLVPAWRAEGAEVITVEGIGTESSLHPVQKAFVDEGAVQCGFCIPAAVLIGKWALDNGLAVDRERIRWAYRGLLCRCGSYIIFEGSVVRAARGE